ncbi:unnamed protein product [Rotaria sp. Silwood1]|nr:unnamed protein product [Rotaria sp. Silwood1]CAF1483866.1 unnamed protein product [Rotaria sp. Silwood1]
MIKSLLLLILFIIVIKASLFSGSINTNATTEINQLPNAIIRIANVFEEISNTFPNETRESFLLFTSELKILPDGTTENLKTFHDALTNFLNKLDVFLNRDVILPFHQVLIELNDNIFQIILANTVDAVDSNNSVNEQIRVETRQTLRLFIQQLEPFIQALGNEYKDLKQMIRTVLGLYTNTKRLYISLVSLIAMIGTSFYLYYENHSQLSFSPENQNWNTVLLTISIIFPCLIWVLSILMYDPFYESKLIALVISAIFCFTLLCSRIVFVLLAGRQRFFIDSVLVLFISLILFVCRSYSPLCAVVTWPYIYHGDHTYYYIPQTSNWIREICPNINQQRCPLVDLKLLDKNENDEMFLVGKTLELLKTLKGPIFIHSEIGDKDTGKSIRQTILTRLLVKYKYRRLCSNNGIRFLVRDVRIDHVKGIAGVTRGIHLMIIPSQWIDYDHLPYLLKDSVGRIRREKGTLLILDMEGGNEVGGAEMKTIRILQLLTMAISTHVNIAIKEHISQVNIKEMATYSQLFNMLKIASESKCNREETSIEPANLDKSSLFTLPSISVLPKSTTNLIPLIKGINITWQGNNAFVKHIQDKNSDKDEPYLDLTDIFWSSLTAVKHSNFKSDADAIGLHFKNLHYLINFPPYPMARGFFSYPDELDIYKNSKSIDLPDVWNRYDNWYGHWFLPEMMKPYFGLTYSLAHYVFPSIFYRMSSRQSSNQETSGVQYVKFIEDLFRSLKGFDGILLESLGINQLEQNICNSITKIINGWKENDIKQFKHLFPIEGKTPCESKQLCNATFDQKWEELKNSLYRSLCISQIYLNKLQWSKCQKSHVDEIIEEQYKDLKKENNEKCSYSWKTDEWSEECIINNCPGYRTRSVYCVNLNEAKRPDNCCNFFLGFDSKPSSKKSCDFKAAKWSPTGWSDCSKTKCGMRTRRVICKWCNGAETKDEECLKSESKPATSEQCNSHYEWKSKEPYSCPCNTIQHKEIWCEKCGSRVSNVAVADCEKLADNIRPPDTMQCPVCSPPDSSCFSGQTLIIMHDKKQKPISQVRPGDYVLTPVYHMFHSRLSLIPQVHGIARVAFVEQRNLGQRSLYGINNIEPFFTSEHIFLTPNGQAVAISPMAMSIEDPSWTIDDVGQMKVNETILFNIFNNETMINNITLKSSKSLDSNIVYSLILDSIHQFYANGFLVSDLFPQLHKFPFTFILFHWLWREKSIDINRYLNESYPNHLKSFSTDDIHHYERLKVFQTKIGSFIDEFIFNQTKKKF